MDRLISEQDVIDSVSEWLYDKTRKESIETVIKAIPTVQDDDYVMIKRTTWEKIEKALDSVSARGC